MAQYNGYVHVPHASYDQWRAATWGNGYNVDYSYGNQCWDFCALLWYQYGLRLITKAGGGGAADCWTISRYVNAQPPFISLTGKENIKRGDILVWNRSRVHSAGHIAFADENYNPNKSSIASYGANQGQGIYGAVNVKEQSYTGFLGIFRNTNWRASPTPPTPTPTAQKDKDKFPWPVAWAHWQNFKH